jgi:hypothetical protein
MGPGIMPVKNVDLFIEKRNGLKNVRLGAQSIRVAIWKSLSMQ